jgi:plastocyanin
MRIHAACVAALGLLWGCGDDGDDHDRDHDAAAVDDAAAIDAVVPDADPDQPDAMIPPDAEPSSVVEVNCTGATIEVTVTAPGFAFAFTPSDGGAADQHTIAVNDIVRFQMPASHNAFSGAANAPDGLFATNFNQTKCYQFTEAGSFPFHCTPHDFVGTLIVQ